MPFFYLFEKTIQEKDLPGLRFHEARAGQTGLQVRRQWREALVAEIGEKGHPDQLRHELTPNR